MTQTDLERARTRLNELERERAALLGVIATLERDAGGPDVTTAAGRVALFASLFRGRQDVFATRWQSTTQPGRSGWAPKCSNEWRPEVCAKPKIKCADCPNRRFVALSQAEVRLHLEGRQTAGIYPLLADETCWLVATDLDGPSWPDDIGALRDAADELDVPVLVERSCSGDGAHLWILFSRPVTARNARAVASLLLTRDAPPVDPDGLLRPALPQPGHDAEGRVRQLIALPLQRARRDAGCTVFLDEALEPHPDQWIHLAGAQRLDGDRAEALAAEADRSGGTLGLTDWSDVPARRVIPLPAAPPNVVEVRVRLAGRVEIAAADLPADLCDRLRRTAAFANPVFFERQRARLSTHRTPRVIACHEETGDVLLLPRGCRQRLEDELGSSGIPLVVTDDRTDGTPIAARFAGILTESQRAAVHAMAAHETGVLVAPPGAGKTVMATALIARRARSTLVLVHRRPLLEQWIRRLPEFLDLTPGQIGSPSGTAGVSGIDVAMIQTLVRRGDVDLSQYGHVIVDECHHVPAVSVERVLRDIPARHITGLTATPQRRDGHHPIIEMQCGPVRHALTQSAQVEAATPVCSSNATPPSTPRAFPMSLASRRSSAASLPMKSGRGASRAMCSPSSRVYASLGYRAG